MQYEIQEFSEEPCEVSDLQASCTGESTGEKMVKNQQKCQQKPNEKNIVKNMIHDDSEFLKYDVFKHQNAGKQCQVEIRY